MGGVGPTGDLGDAWQFVHQADCLGHRTCAACTGAAGCGWCWANMRGYECVSGAGSSAYLTGSCRGDPATALNTEPLLCPADGFPSWAIALIVIGAIVVVGIVVFAITKMRKASEYEEIN